MTEYNEVSHATRAVVYRADGTEEHYIIMSNGVASKEEEKPDMPETTTQALATISFQAEAHETAMRFFHMLTDDHHIGYVATIVLQDGEKFDAKLMDIQPDSHDGQYKLIVAPWDEDRADGDPDQTRSLDIYDEIERVVII